jgi:hypothetical protein
VVCGQAVRGSGIGGHAGGSVGSWRNGSDGIAGQRRLMTLCWRVTTLVFGSETQPLECCCVALAQIKGDD